MTADLSITVNGMKFENPFVLGSGPPGTNGKVIARSYDLGWGGMVCKTFSLDASKVINTAPRYAKLRGRRSDEVIGFQNIELISDRPYEDWLDDLEQLKKNYPNKILIASIMEEYRKEAWQQIVARGPGDRRRRLRAQPVVPARLARAQDGHGDGREPRHRRGGRRLGEGGRAHSGVGEDDAERRQPDGARGARAARRRRWHRDDQHDPLACAASTCKTLRPMPTVEGHSVPGGYSGQAVRPIALRQVMEVARANPGVRSAASAASRPASTRRSSSCSALDGPGLHRRDAARLRDHQRAQGRAQQVHGRSQVREHPRVRRQEPAVLHDAPRSRRSPEGGARREGSGARDARPARDVETWKGDIAKETSTLVTN